METYKGDEGSGLGLQATLLGLASLDEGSGSNARDLGAQALLASF